MNLKSYQQWSWFLSTIVVVTLGMTSVEILRHQLGASAYEELTLLEIGSILGLSGVWVTLSGVCFVSLNRGLSVFLSISNTQNRLNAITRITLLIIGSIVVGYWFVLPLSLHHNLVALVCCIALSLCILGLGQLRPFRELWDIFGAPASAIPLHGVCISVGAISMIIPKLRSLYHRIYY